MSRAYTAQELDALRSVLEYKWVWWTYNTVLPPSGKTIRSSRSYQVEEKIRCVEELLRTSMIAGHTADDLLRSESPISAEDGIRAPFDSSACLSSGHIEALRDWLIANTAPDTRIAGDYTMRGLINDLGRILEGMWNDGIDAMGEDA